MIYKKRLKKVIIYTFIIVSLIFVDIYSKHVVVNFISEKESISVLGNYIKFTLTYNYGTTFGFLQDSAPHLAISVVKLIFIIVLLLVFLNISKIIKNSKSQIISRICILFIIAGSIANIIDRLIYNKVTDFIDIGINGYRWYIFNLADAFQFIGGLIFFYLLLVDYIKTKYYSVIK